jgi:hypothetical protein
MNRLSNEDRCRVLACLVEGNSIRSTVRITGICKRTVSRLLVEFGESCERFMGRTMTGLPCKAIQCEWARIRKENGYRKSRGINLSAGTSQSGRQHGQRAGQSIQLNQARAAVGAGRKELAR